MSLTKEELRLWYVESINIDSIDSCLSQMDIFAEYLWSTILKFNGRQLKNSIEKDAAYINQMVFTRLLNLRNLVFGFEYQSDKYATNLKAIDPTVLSILTRNIFELVSTFNLVFRGITNSDEKSFTYSLWILAGLRHRQKYSSIVTLPENILKLDVEKKRIEQLLLNVRSNKLYTNLDAENKKKIDVIIKKKDYRLSIIDNKVIVYDWQDLCDVIGLKKELFSHMYTHLSLNAHPSYVSVQQFEYMLDTGLDALKSSTIQNLKYCLTFLSVFIADFINVFPWLIDTFNSMQIHEQISLNCLNQLNRGQQFAINDVERYL